MFDVTDQNSLFELKAQLLLCSAYFLIAALLAALLEISPPDGSIQSFIVPLLFVAPASFVFTGIFRQQIKNLNRNSYNFEWNGQYEKTNFFVGVPTVVLLIYLWMREVPNIGIVSSQQAMASGPFLGGALFAFIRSLLIKGTQNAHR
jgi:hypothetical protein